MSFEPKKKIPTIAAAGLALADYGGGPCALFNLGNPGITLGRCQ